MFAVFGALVTVQLQLFVATAVQGNSNDHDAFSGRWDADAIEIAAQKHVAFGFNFEMLRTGLDQLAALGSE